MINIEFEIEECGDEDACLWAVTARACGKEAGATERDREKAIRKARAALEEKLLR